MHKDIAWAVARNAQTSAERGEPAPPAVTPLTKAQASTDETIRGASVGAVRDCIDTMRAMLRPDPFVSQQYQAYQEALRDAIRALGGEA